jgi:SPASM domain peptide maturase of grasp-with-spasm system
MNHVLKLFSNCIPVKGKHNSIVCDLQRGDYEFIPNDLYNILKKFDGKKSVDEVKVFFENQYDDIIDEYFDFLLKKEFIFYTSTPNYYPKMDMKFNYPFEVSNAIMEIDSNDVRILRVIDSLDKINCKFLEIRSYEEVSISVIELILNYISDNEMIISSINIIIQFYENINHSELTKIMKKHPRVANFVIVNSIYEERIILDEKKQTSIFFTKEKINGNLHCGKIYPYLFAINIKSFTESLHHNSCLHKKISIDKEGNIKNCPSMTKSFGNIHDTTLEETLNHKDFKKYWNLTKDNIEVCKDCEFRYICTDCRAYTERTHENKEGLDISKPLKCGYNPYIGEWEEWSTNPLKEKAIKYYGMQELVKKN